MNPGETGAEQDGNPALRKLFTHVFDKMVDESVEAAEAARYARACTSLLNALFGGIVEVTEIEHPRAELEYTRTCSEEDFQRYVHREVYRNG